MFISVKFEVKFEAEIERVQLPEGGIMLIIKCFNIMKNKVRPI